MSKAKALNQVISVYFFKIEMSESLSNHECYTIFVLFFVNVANYIDRYSIAGILRDLKAEFRVGDDYGGLLQTAFICAFTVFAPIFGYIGDRYNRKKIMICSVLFWTSATVMGSFTRSYGWFFLFRVFVGIGTASFTTIAPTVIYDLTYKKIRKDALALFYIAIPIGSGLGFVLGVKASMAGDHWCWALRVTPILTVIGCILMYLMKEPVRGEHERLEMGQDVSIETKSTNSFKKVLLTLLRNKSYMLSTAGFASVTFSTGALAWWGAIYVHSGFVLIPGKEDYGLGEVAANFGGIAVCTGLIGVPLGACLARKLSNFHRAIDPIICGAGLILSDPLVAKALFSANQSVNMTYLCIFFGELLINITYTLVADILLSVVVPEARSTAEAFQITISHAFGDAGSPYLVGLLSERFKKKWEEKHPDLSPTKIEFKRLQEFESMRDALLLLVILQFLGGILFIVNAFYVVGDRQLVIEAIATGSTTRIGRDPSAALAVTA